MTRNDGTSTFALAMACLLVLLAFYLVMVFLPRTAERIGDDVLAKLRAECCPDARTMADLRERIDSAVRQVETMVSDRRLEDEEARELLGIPAVVLE